MNQYYLRKLSEDMGQAEWKMYRAIPAEEIGWENGAHHLSYDEWRDYLKRQIAKEFCAKPKMTYIMYLASRPMGIAKLKHCAEEGTREVAYCLRPAERGRGLGKTMLELLKQEAQHQGFVKLIGYANKRNQASCKTMESCGFQYAGLSSWGSNKYEISLSEHLG